MFYLHIWVTRVRVCVCIVYRWHNISRFFSHMMQSAPRWSVIGLIKLVDHLRRCCPWLPANQHAVVTFSQWWISISLLIALHLLSKSETIESKLSLGQAICQHRLTDWLTRLQNVSVAAWLHFHYSGTRQMFWSAVALEMLRKTKTRATTGRSIESAVDLRAHWVADSDGNMLCSVGISGNHISLTWSIRASQSCRMRNWNWFLKDVIKIQAMTFATPLFKCNYRNVIQRRGWGKHPEIEITHSHPHLHWHR